MTKKYLYIVLVASLIAAALGAGYWLGHRPEHAAAAETVQTGVKVLLLGVDGAEWTIIDSLMAQNKLPNMARLIRGGVRGRLRTLEPILSPVIWTSIATGKTPEKHGITWFMAGDPEHSSRVPVQSTMRECRAVWNILSDENRTVGVVGWWATWPAERVKGFVVTDYIAYHGFALSGKEVKTELGKTFPDSLYHEVSGYFFDPLTLTKDKIDPFMNITQEEWEFSVHKSFDFINPLHHFMFALATAMAYRDVGLSLYKQYRPDLMAVYFEQVDSVSHLYMKYTAPKLEDMEESLFEKYKDTVPRFYEFQDQIIGDFLAEKDPNTVVIINSDHGFKTGDKRLKEVVNTDLSKAHLWHELEGVLIMSGGPIKKGAEIKGASVLDITPTILYLLGLPVASDMDGKVLLDTIDESFRNKYPIRFKTTYESKEPEEKEKLKEIAEQGSGVDEEVTKQLEALGYVGGGLKDTGIKLNKVQILLDKGQTKEALKVLDEVQAKDPENQQAMLYRSTALIALKRTDEALTLLQKLQEQEGQGENDKEKNQGYGLVHRQLADIYYEKGDTVQAKKEFQRVTEINPKDFEAIYNLGVMAEQRGDLDQAIDYYLKVVEINPGHAFSYNNLGNCYKKRGEIQKAIESYKKTAETDPQHVECHYNLGVTFLEIGKIDDAVQEFTRALELKPDMVQARLALGNAYFSGKKYDQAVAEYTRLLEADPSSVQFNFSIGRAEAYAGQNQDALTHLKKARDQAPKIIQQKINEDQTLKALFK